ncbi:MAG: permease-like cell division protein FtsX [Gammaproteobacteria bacterium]|nr:permease-like cell division protein FtsX [Gammaproteobacteria bacterium]
MVARSKSSGATVAVTGIRGRTSSWAAHHRRVAVESLSSLLATWLNSLMTWLVIGIALALPIILYLMLVNVGEISGDWDGKPRISLYLVHEASETDARDLARRLLDRPDIESTSFISAHNALAEFRAMSGFGDVLSTLNRNPLPAVIEIKPSMTDVGQLRLQVTSLAGLDLVDTVVFDLEWIERLFAILQFGERLVAAIGFVLALGVLLIIGNTIRLAIENRRSEIEIVKLVGGTDSFVRRPFLYLGFWYGLGGALVAWILVQGSLLFLSAPVETLAQSYRDDFTLSGPGILDSLIILGAGAGLGILGALVAVSRHLKEIEPE